MKKFISGFLCGAILFGVTSAYGAEAYQKVQTLLRSDVKVSVNGKNVSLSKPALSYNGNVYLSVNDMANISNKNVFWKSSTQTLEITEKTSNSTIPKQSSNETAPSFKLLKGFSTVVKIDDEMYKLQNGFTIYEDNKGLYYSGYNLGDILQVMAISYDGYTIKTSDNPYVKGEIAVDPNVSTKLLSIETKYASVNKEYRIYTLYSLDKTKQYVISEEPNKTQGVVMMDGRQLIPLNSLFTKLGVNVQMEKNTKENLFIFSFDK